MWAPLPGTGRINKGSELPAGTALERGASRQGQPSAGRPWLQPSVVLPRPSPPRTTTERVWAMAGSQGICRDRSPRPLQRRCDVQRHQSNKATAEGNNFSFDVGVGLVSFKKKKRKKKKRAPPRLGCAILADLPWGNKLHMALYTNTAPNTSPAGSTVALLSPGK